MADDEFVYTEERASDDDPIIYGRLWKVELEIARKGLQDAYSALLDETLAPRVTPDAVSAALSILSQALVDCYAVGS